jgi:hypothetical protein
MTELKEPVVVEVWFEERYYNKNCGCYIPAKWCGRLLDERKEFDGMKEHYGESFSVRGETRDEAIEALGRWLRENGFTGKLRIAA